MSKKRSKAPTAPVAPSPSPDQDQSPDLTAEQASAPELPPELPERSKLVTGKLGITRDPRVYAQRIPKIAPLCRRVLGIDLGTNCGVAFCDFIPGLPVTQAPIVMGQWDLSVGPYDTGVLRHIRLMQFLAILQPDLIMYEDVKYVPPAEMLARGVTAVIARVATSAEFLGGLKTTLATWAAMRDIPTHGVGIGVIKKFATGKGVAAKEVMIAAANAQFGTDFDPATYESTGADNICDAAFVCKMGVDAYSEGLPLGSAEIANEQEQKAGGDLDGGLPGAASPPGP